MNDKDFRVAATQLLSEIQWAGTPNYYYGCCCPACSTEIEEGPASAKVVGKHTSDCKIFVLLSAATEDAT